MWTATQMSTMRLGNYPPGGKHRRNSRPPKMVRGLVVQTDKSLVGHRKRVTELTSTILSAVGSRFLAHSPPVHECFVLFATDMPRPNSVPCDRVNIGLQFEGVQISFSVRAQSTTLVNVNHHRE